MITVHYGNAMTQWKPQVIKYSTKQMWSQLLPSERSYFEVEIKKDKFPMVSFLAQANK